MRTLCRAGRHVTQASGCPVTPRTQCHWQWRSASRMASNTYFVAGITGNVGGATARGLLAAGNKVRTLLRDPAKPSAAAWAARGVDVRAGDLADGDALAVALHGVAGAYVMNAPSFTSNTVEAHAFAASFEHALLAAHPPRVVALSSVGAEKASGTGLIGASHVLEQGLRKLAHAIPVAFVRAGSFYENNAWALGVAGATGFFDTFWTPLDRPYASVATADIGAEVARLLTGAPWTGAKTVELGTGASSNQIAAALAAALGKPVVARGIPREHWAAAIQGMGVPAGLTGPMEATFDAILSGWIAFGDPGAEVVPATTTPSQFFSELAAVASASGKGVAQPASE